MKNKKVRMFNDGIVSSPMHIEKGIPTPQHTPTPWKANGLSIEDSNGDLIACLNTGDGIVRAHEDAAFIVRAVNAHDELLQALKDCVGELQFHAESLPDGEIERALKAIAKAEGK